MIPGGVCFCFYFFCFCPAGFAANNDECYKLLQPISLWINSGIVHVYNNNFIAFNSIVKPVMFTGVDASYISNIDRWFSDKWLLLKCPEFLVNLLCKPLCN